MHSLGRRLGLLFIVLMLFSHCGQNGVVGIAGAKKPSSDGQRPTDSSEGLPGYLTDPAAIQAIDEEDDSVTITGEPGAVKAVASVITDLQIVVWNLPETEAEAAINGADLDISDAVAAAAVAPDGSLWVNGLIDKDLSIIVGLLTENQLAKGGTIKLPFSYDEDRPLIAYGEDGTFLGVDRPAVDDSSLTENSIVQSCIERNELFTDGLPVERLKGDSGLLGITYDDDRARGTPTIVLVEHTSAVNLSITMNLRDPDALYCVSVDIFTAGRLSLNYDANAVLDDSQVNVGLTGIYNKSKL